MKVIRSTFCTILIFVLCGVLSISVFAAASPRGTCHLGVTARRAETGGYAGTVGYGALDNSSESAGNVKLTLQLSDGTGYVSYATVTAAPGRSNQTSDWGNYPTEYLYKVVVVPSTIPAIGYPGCIADGHVYSGYG